MAVSFSILKTDEVNYMQISAKINQKRKVYNIIGSVRELEKYITGLPDKDVVYKFVTDGGFSSISFVKYIADHTHVYEFYASSFRIGKKELLLINSMFSSGHIDRCHFAVGTLMASGGESGRKYGYYECFKGLCDRNGWEYMVVNNHSKILLFNTDKGKYVIETSSNLNENPKIEQFSFEQSEELFEFYKGVFESWKDTEE